MRRILRVPVRTHCRLLPLQGKCSSIEVSIQNRIRRFVCSMLNGSNVIIKCLANRCRYHCVSPMGSNMSCISLQCVMNGDDACIFKARQVNHDFVNNSDEADSATCCELIDTRDGLSSIECLTRSECIEIINLLCTN